MEDGGSELLLDLERQKIQRELEDMQSQRNVHAMSTTRITDPRPRNIPGAYPVAGIGEESGRNNVGLDDEMSSLEEDIESSSPSQALDSNREY